MRKLRYIIILLSLALLLSSCGDMFNEESEAPLSYEEQSEVSETSDESEETSKAIIYTPPDVQIPEEPEYNLDEYSPFGTEGAVKIIIRYDDVYSKVDETYRGSKEITDVYIEDGITAIAANAFRDCTSLKTVRLPKTLQTFETDDKGGSHCFAGCTTLKEVYIPEGVTQIPAGTFDGCFFLRNVSLPEGLETISYEAFRDTAITEIKLPDTLKFLGRESLPFENIKALELPDNLTSIYYVSSKVLFVRENSPTHNFLQRYTRTYPEETQIIFKDGGPYVEPFDPEVSTDESLYTLPNVQIPKEPEYDLSTYSPFGTKGATKIIIRYEDVGDTIDESDNLHGNTEITDVYIEDGITAIGYGAFKGCTALKSVRLPKTLETFGGEGYGGNSFCMCTSLEAIYIPEGIKIIPACTFYNCDSLKAVLLPEGLKKIEVSAFQGTAITAIKLPSTLTYLGGNALPFHKIKVLELPDNIEFAGYIDCEALFVTKNSNTHWLFTHTLVASSITKILFK